ncbi:hypothetical protein BV20DRAFT_950620 [Pilatotrama ljubarskyi]|nr:hypothetical protein BV20DRAFT_950620 [Pilatotrama ljubarskyi]
MQTHVAKHDIAASPRELDAKLELLQQLGYSGRFFDDDDVAPLSEKSAYIDHETDRWIQTEYNWALQEATDSAVSIPDLFDVEEEDEEACLPYVYDPTLFTARQSAPSTPRTRSQSLTQTLRSDYDKPLPSVPPLRLRPRPSLPIVPPPTPASASKPEFSSPAPSVPVSPRSFLAERKQTPPPSPRLSARLSSSPKPRPFPRPHASSVSSTCPRLTRPSAQRHATYPSISSTMSLLEERETEAEKRAAVYVADKEPAARPPPRLAGRGRSSSAAVLRSSDESYTPFPVNSSPRRKQRPTLPALTTSHSTPQLRNLAELATMPSPSLAPSSTLLPSPMSDTTATPDSEVVSPGEAITCSPFDGPAEDAEVALASRWSLDSVASRPRFGQVVPDLSSSSPASKTKKRDRLLSLISGRSRSGSVGKPNPPPNTPRGSSDVLDIRRIDSREAMQSTSRPSFSMSSLPPRALAPSVSSSSSSNGSSASTLATPVEPMHPTPLPDIDPFASGGSSCMFEEEPVFAENPHLTPESPLLAPEKPKALPSPPREPLTLQIPSRPATPGSPPPQPTLPLPSPGTPSPSFLVPTPRSQSFFASLKGRQRRRKKKLVISGAPLEISSSRAPSSLSAMQTPDDMEHRKSEQQRRVDNVIKWCESFGPVRKIETKEDGSLHVYWKDWEVADMVCRIQAQVVIKDVGRVNLAWSYIS